MRCGLRHARADRPRHARRAAGGRGVRPIGSACGFVAGSELSVRPPSGSMHLLAYLPSADAEPLATRIREIGEYRAGRNQRIVERLNELGYAVEWDDVARRARGRVGRPHIAAALVDAGYVESVQEAFDRLLADGQPAYVDAGSLGTGGGRRGRRRERGRARARPSLHAAHGRFRARALRRAPRRLPACEASNASGRTTTTASAHSPNGCARGWASCRPEAPTGTATPKARISAIPGRCRFPRTRSRGSGSHERAFLLR